MSQQPIRIGYCLSLTGPLASNGKTARLAHQIWENDVNRKGGLLGRKLQMICIDDETDPKLVPEIYKRLLDDEKVDLVIGGYGDNSVGDAADHGAKTLSRCVDGPRRKRVFRLLELFCDDPDRTAPERGAYRRLLCLGGKAIPEAGVDGNTCCGCAIFQGSRTRRQGACG